MDEIEIKRDWSTIDRVGIGKILLHRYHGKIPGRVIGVISGLIGYFYIVIVFVLYKHRMLLTNTIYLALAIALGVIIIALLNNRWRNQLSADLNKAPIRKANLSVYLTAKGISDYGFTDSGAIEWQFITDVIETKSVILLLISPAEFIPLQDSGLPSGLTRTDLLEQIAKWREAAAP